MPGTLVARRPVPGALATAVRAAVARARGGESVAHERKRNETKLAASPASRIMIFVFCSHDVHFFSVVI